MKKQSLVSKNRVYFFIGISIVLFFLFIPRLFYLQIIKGSYYEDLARNNRIRIVKTDAPRGFIYDNEGKILASNIPSIDLIIYPYLIEEHKETLDYIAKTLKISLEEIKKTIKDNTVSKFQGVVVKKNLDKNIAVKLLEVSEELAGMDVIVTTKRFYPQISLASHLIGIIGEIDKQELKLKTNYDFKDIIGKSGIENYYEDYLKGKKGLKLIEVDSIGKVNKIIKEEDPQAGNNIYLTINSDLQKKAEEILNNKPGSVIVLNSKDGSIYALASSPGFDLNIFTRKISQNEWEELQKDHKLLNRTIQGLYPPASTFKVITGTAGLESGIINDKTIISCNGSINEGSRTFKCWVYPGAHGPLNIKTALAYSCDVYFYTLAKRLGIERLSYYALSFGLGKLSGIDLNEELSGVVPTEKYKIEKTGESWYSGDTMNMGIGQGFLLTTPLRMALVYSSLKNNGTMMKPHLLKEIRDSQNKLVTRYNSEIIENIHLKDQTLKSIKEGLNLVTKTGSTSTLQIPGLKIYAKTGTAQTGLKTKDHFWLIAFAEDIDPVFLIMFEHGDFKRSGELAPLMKELIESYLKIYKN